MDDINEGRKAIKELCDKINYKEGVTKLEPHFVETKGVDVTHTPFRYYGTEGLVGNDKEMILSCVMKSIIQFEEGTKELSVFVFDKVKSQFPDGSLYVNTTPSITCGSTYFNLEKSLTIRICSLEFDIIFT